MKQPKSTLFLIGLLTVSAAAYATCEDIAAGCAKAHELDTQACVRNYSGQQQQDCMRRADQQFNNCYNGHGCK
jgi:hypothetical protein